MVDGCESLYTQECTCVSTATHSYVLCMHTFSHVLTVMYIHALIHRHTHTQTLQMHTLPSLRLIPPYPPIRTHSHLLRPSPSVSLSPQHTLPHSLSHSHPHPIDANSPLSLLLLPFIDVLCISVAPMFQAAPIPAPLSLNDGPLGSGAEGGIGTSVGAY